MKPPISTNPTTVSQPRATVYDVLLDPKRIRSLQDCDKNLLSYNPYSFWMVFRVRGRHFEMIALPLLLLLLWDLFWGFFLITFEDPLDISQYIESMQSLITPLLTPVSFLLVFRLGRAAVRYWDARAAMGKMVEVCRTISSTALVGCYGYGGGGGGDSNQIIRPQQQKILLADNFVRWIAVFPIAVKNFLRQVEGVNCNRINEIGDLLSKEDRPEFLAMKGQSLGYAPILVLNRIRQLSLELASCYHYNSTAAAADAATMSGVLFRQLNEQIDALTGAWGAMERIHSTPLPFIYVVHLRTFLLLYLILWHMEAIATSGWIALLPLQLASWGLLGIEAAAVECERPFEWHSNHLALGKACIVVARNVAQTYDNFGWTKEKGPRGALPREEYANIGHARLQQPLEGKLPSRTHDYGVETCV